MLFVFVGGQGHAQHAGVKLESESEHIRLVIAPTYSWYIVWCRDHDINPLSNHYKWPFKLRHLRGYQWGQTEIIRAGPPPEHWGLDELFIVRQYEREWREAQAAKGTGS